MKLAGPILFCVAPSSHQKRRQIAVQNVISRAGVHLVRHRMWLVVPTTPRANSFWGRVLIPAYIQSSTRLCSRWRTMQSWEMLKTLRNCGRRGRRKRNLTSCAWVDFILHLCLTFCEDYVNVVARPPLFGLGRRSQTETVLKDCYCSTINPVFNDIETTMTAKTY